MKRRLAMKKSFLNKSLLCLLILLSALDLAIGEDNFSIPVSCSIPAVPGLNAPEVEPRVTATQDAGGVDAENLASVTSSAKTIYNR